MARRPKAVAVVTNKAVVARIKPPPRPMMAISSAEPAEDQPHRFGIGALARRQVAAQRLDQIADRENAEPDGDHDRHRVRPHAVGVVGLQLARVPHQHRGQGRERQCNDNARGIDAPRRRALRQLAHDLTRPTDFSTSVTRAVSFFRKSANASPPR